MSARLELIRWCATHDSNDLEQAEVAYPCFVCGQPTRTFGVSFCAAAHLRCNVRYWEMFVAESQAAAARRAVERLQELRPETNPEDEGLPF